MGTSVFGLDLAILSNFDKGTIVVSILALSLISFKR